MSSLIGNFWTILVIIYGLSSCTAQSHLRSLSEPISNRTSVEDSVAQIARQVSVRILTHSGSGSGVIIAHYGSTYSVITNHHVISDHPEKGYIILTADGRTYPAQWVQNKSFGTDDLALVQFTSTVAYKVVQLGKTQISVGDRVYAAGFPSWHFTKQDNKITALENTRDWGGRAFRLTTGTVKMLPQRSLKEGYQIGYTNDIVEGMSGGPVLNPKGELIGINGRLKYPLRGIKTFSFADGTTPSPQQLYQMETLSWAIGIAQFQHLIQL